MPTKIFPDYYSTKQTRVVANETAYTHQKITKKWFNDPCLFGRAEIWKKIGWHFGRNDDLVKSFFNSAP